MCHCFCHLFYGLKCELYYYHFTTLLVEVLGGTMNNTGGLSNLSAVYGSVSYQTNSL